MSQTYCKTCGAKTYNGNSYCHTHKYKHAYDYYSKAKAESN